MNNDVSMTILASYEPVKYFASNATSHLTSFRISCRDSI